MNKAHKARLAWLVLAIVVVTFGLLHGWTAFDKLMLAVVAGLGALLLAGPALRRRLLRRLRGMSPAEREKFLARFDRKTRELLQQQLESPDA